MKILPLGAKQFPAFRNFAKVPKKMNGKQILAFLQTIRDR